MSSIHLKQWRIDFADGWTTASHADSIAEAVRDAAEAYLEAHSTRDVPRIANIQRLADDEL